MAQGNDLWNLDSTQTLSVFEDKKRNNDGLYRPDPKDGDAATGYVARIRFLPNFTRNEVVEAGALEKHTHYIKLEDMPELNGTYDCQKVFGEPNPLYDAYWKLKNSRSPIDNEKAKLVTRQTKYYSYVLIVEDRQHPELEGKILIFQYGYKISQKIKDEKSGTYGPPVNIYDLAEGKDFILVVKTVGGYNNYDGCKFVEQSPITFVKNGEKKTMPTEKSGDRLVIASSVRDKVKEILLKREHDLEEFAPKKWTEEDKSKVGRIVAYLLGTNADFSSARQSISTAANAASGKSTTFEAAPANSTTKQVDDFFSDL